MVQRRLLKYAPPHRLPCHALHQSRRLQVRAARTSVQLKASFKESCETLGLKGTILLSPEGINVFVSGSKLAATRFKAFVHADPRLAGLRFKESVSSYPPFKRMLVKIKKEIITLRVAGLDPACATRAGRNAGRTQALAG